MLRRIAQKLGYQRIPKVLIGPAQFNAAYERCKPFTMTSRERMFSLWEAMEWLNTHHIDGAFVECGVWKGGSSMLASENCRLHPAVLREFYLYDTFEGMSTPEEVDKNFKGESADVLMETASVTKESNNIWAVGPIDQVRENMIKSRVPSKRLHLIQGDVEQTIRPNTGPADIALLRLDTDWYRSTKHELTHLFHRIVPGGFLIIDDYGHWTGCQKAVDEFFQGFHPHPFFHRIDYTGIITQIPY